MTQLIVTIEDGSNLNVIKNAINLIKGVKNTVVSHTDSNSGGKRTMKRLRAFDKLAGSLSIDRIDNSDPRTNYLLGK